MTTIKGPSKPASTVSAHPAAKATTAAPATKPAAPEKSGWVKMQEAIDRGEGAGTWAAEQAAIDKATDDDFAATFGGAPSKPGEK